MFRNIFILATAVLLSAGLAFAEVRSFKVDPAVSSITWTGRKVLGSHNGVVALKNGTAEIESGKLVGGSFEIDMSSISVADIKDPKENSKLTNHLKSEDFFAANNFPVAKFTITKAEAINNAAAGAPNFMVTGNLSLLGMAKEIQFPANITISENEAIASGVAKVDRTLWNIRYGSGKFFDDLGDKVIYDHFEVAMNLKAKA